MSDIGLDPPIAREYERWLEKIGPDDPYAGPDTLGIHDVLRAHFLIADFFYKEGEGIGGLGPRDLELLHSATYRQHITLDGKPKWRDKYEICATLMYGLIKDHPFHDANKRTAFLSTLYFLFKQNRVPTIPAKEFEDFTVLVADNGLSKFSRYKELTKKKDDPEVLYMAHYIKSNTRQVDRRYYVVTYRELDSLLRKFSVRLDNPSGNYIDVIEDRKKRKGVFRRRETIESVRLLKVGFPGWSKQVNQGALASIRRQTGLTAENGIDSQTFFKGQEDLRTLIAEYQDALKSLAVR